jgi:hypothetical protein
VLEFPFLNYFTQLQFVLLQCESVRDINIVQNPPLLGEEVRKTMADTEEKKEQESSEEPEKPECAKCGLSCSCGMIDDKIASSLSPLKVILIFLLPLLAFIGGLFGWQKIAPEGLSSQTSELIGLVCGIAAAAVMVIVARWILKKLPVTGEESTNGNDGNNK